MTQTTIEETVSENIIPRQRHPLICPFIREECFNINNPCPDNYDECRHYQTYIITRRETL